MDRIPQEILDGVLAKLACYHYPHTERFPTLSPLSRTSILSARLVCRAFLHSKDLKDLFITVLEETLFLREGWYMPKLQAISSSEYAASMTTLSICSITNYCLWADELWNEAFCDYLASVIRRCPRVRHLRYYTISPKCIQRGQPAPCPMLQDDMFGYSIRHSGGSAQMIRATTLNWILQAVERANIPLDTITMPLFGNQAAWCATWPVTALFPRSLTHVAMNITGVHRLVFDHWMRNLENLEFLEIALSSMPILTESFRHVQQLVDEASSEEERVRLPKLKEFRLMADNRYCFSTDNIVSALYAFPNLKMLGFAHIMLRSGSWGSLLTRLQALDLDRVWLLDPRIVLWDPDPPEDIPFIFKYEDRGDAENAARDVRLFHTDVVEDGHRVLQRRYDLEYPGFAIFEQAESEMRRG
ncbi:hypothetical protein BU26DRAFT_74377 [Trematosphaeria pertusa]|uniref:Uncharacterized protein n=1 Tax=Trematosphaeria pertusa TaxID=390896 RepID=A0A6A6I5C1_9PLEO|nr:uncharacterized protein BU26DRAFT_74377 [Trematosphaeria pertusa]KAF2245715.1 hypothetical protein BU26DRAFT_74377 [Trematosphaeria pertusa]